jgi:hypothetical protein
MATRKKIKTAPALPVVADPFLSIRSAVVAAGAGEAALRAAVASYNDRAIEVLAWLTASGFGPSYLESDNFRPVFTAAFAEGLLSADDLATWRDTLNVKGAAPKGSAVEALRDKVAKGVRAFVKRIVEFHEANAAAAASGASVTYRDTGKPVVAGAKGASRTAKVLLERLDEAATKALDWIKADSEKDTPTFKGDVAELRRVTLMYRQMIRDLNKTAEPKH